MGPCVAVGLAADGPDDFATDAEHFIYLPEGEDVSVSVYADFTPSGATCDSECSHELLTTVPEGDHTLVLGSRYWQWSVSGSSDYDYDDGDTDILSRHGTFTFRDVSAGDSITISAKVSDMNPGDCDEDRFGNPGEHKSAAHAGATAACTIKLWRLDLETDADLDSQLGSPHYKFEFASIVTTSATLIGASALNYQWESWVDGALHAEVPSGGSSWAGEIVAYTSVDCGVTVANRCDLSETSFATRTVYLSPSLRRPDWSTEVEIAAVDSNWLSGVSRAFPQYDWSRDSQGIEPTYGRNANVREPYDKNYNAVVVPIYNDETNYRSDYNKFPTKTKEITSGPNTSFFFNSDPTFYEIKRQILSNYWISPSAGHPAVPSLDNNGNPYTNWLAVFESHFGADCKCLSPSVHGGIGTGAFYQANLYHEGYGNPNSPNNRLLGHQSRLEDYFAAHDRMFVDPIYRCDLLYSNTVDGLRAKNEIQRSDASDRLLLGIGALHGYIKSDPAKHNYKGDVIVYTPTGGWVAVGKDTF